MAEAEASVRSASLHVSVYLYVPAESVRVVVPEVATLPDHESEAVQELAWVDDQVSVTS